MRRLAIIALLLVTRVAGAQTPTATPETAPAPKSEAPTAAPETATPATETPAETPPAVTISPEAQAAFERGRREWELGMDLPAAKTALDEAIRLAPNYADAFLYRAQVIAHDRGIGPARADFEHAMALKPDSKEVHRFYGEALADGGDVENAEQRYRRALELDPNYADAIYLLARLLRGKGDLDGAIALYEKHAVINPQGTAHHALGEIFLQKGDDERAAVEFAADLATDATCYESRMRLAQLDLEKGSFTEARDQYEESLAYHPADAAALSGLGRAYLALGDYELAVGTLRSAQSLSPEDAEVKDALAKARLRLRLQYGWPFAVLPLVLVVILYVYFRRRRA